MKMHWKSIVLGTACVVGMGWQEGASAGWTLTVTASPTSESVSTTIVRTNMAGGNPGNAGSLSQGLLRQQPNYGDAYYAAQVGVSFISCGSNSKTTALNASISGTKEWSWQWTPEPGKNVSDYLWDYSVKGVASADAMVEMEDNGGYGKMVVNGWVKVEADSANSSPQSSAVAAGAGVEVREDGGALSGAGVEIGATGVGVSLSWDWGATQLDASRSVTEYVTLSEVTRPGAMCWVKVHTAASTDLGAFHDTFKYGNVCSGFGGIVENYSSLKLNEPAYIPE